MNTVKMRHQRGRVRPTVRPLELAAHPHYRWQWQVKVVVLGHGRAVAVCAHCDRRMPCPTEAYLHGRDGHDGGDMCGGLGHCDMFERARYAREHETL